MLKKTNYRFYELEKAQRHNQREIFESSITHPDKTSLNYDVLNKKLINYKNAIRRYLTHLSASKSIHSNWIVLLEWQIIFEESSLDKLSARETKLFFLQVVQTFQKLYGISNIIYANVHFDEEKPHLHIGLIPMKEGRLNSTHIIAKYKNSELEAELLTKLTNMLKQNKNSVCNKNISDVHNTKIPSEHYLEYHELYNKLLNQSILPSETKIKETHTPVTYPINKVTEKKVKTIEELKKENDYLESLVKKLKSENNYLLKVIKDTEKNMQLLEKQLTINDEISKSHFGKIELENKNYIKKLTEI